MKGSVSVSRCRTLAEVLTEAFPGATVRILSDSVCDLTLGSIESARQCRALAALVTLSFTGEKWIILLEKTVSGVHLLDHFGKLRVETIFAYATADRTSSSGATFGLQLAVRGRAIDVLYSEKSRATLGTLHPATSIFFTLYCCATNIDTGFTAQLEKLLVGRPHVTMLPQSPSHCFESLENLRNHILIAQSTAATIMPRGPLADLLAVPSVVEVLRFVTISGRSALGLKMRSSVAKLFTFDCNVRIGKHASTEHGLRGETVLGEGWRHRLVVIGPDALIILNALTAAHVQRQLSGVFFSLSCITGVILDAKNHNMLHVVCCSDSHGTRSASSQGEVVVGILLIPPTSSMADVYDRSSFVQCLHDLKPSISIKLSSDHSEDELRAEAAILQVASCIVDGAVTLQEGLRLVDRQSNRGDVWTVSPDELQLVWRSLVTHPRSFLASLSAAVGPGDGVIVQGVADAVVQSFAELAGGPALGIIAVACLAALVLLDQQFEMSEHLTCPVPQHATLLFHVLLRWCEVAGLSSASLTREFITSHQSLSAVVAAALADRRKMLWLAFALVKVGGPQKSVDSVEEIMELLRRSALSRADECQVTDALWLPLIAPYVASEDGRNTLAALDGTLVLNNAERWDLLGVPAESLRVRPELALLARFARNNCFRVQFWLCAAAEETTSATWAAKHWIGQSVRTTERPTQADLDPALAAQVRAQQLFLSSTDHAAASDIASLASPPRLQDEAAIFSRLSPMRVTSIPDARAAGPQGALDEVMVLQKEVEMLHAELRSLTKRCVTREVLLQDRDAEIQRLQSQQLVSPSPVRSASTIAPREEEISRSERTLLLREENLRRRELYHWVEEARFRALADLTRAAFLDVSRHSATSASINIIVKEAAPPG